MPLKLVTGPANAAKAGEVLGGLRARLDDDPILVVPTVADVEHAQRELADRGAIFGARVMRFDWLFREMAARAGFGGREASDFQRELIVEQAIRRARLNVLVESAAQPGFVRAAARFVAELNRSMVEPAHLTRSLRQWAGDGPRRAYADEVSGLYRAYREGLEAAVYWTLSCSRGEPWTFCAPHAPGATRRCSYTGSTTSPRWSYEPWTRSRTGVTRT